MSQNEIKTMFEYNGVSYDFDVRDADDEEKFENALESLQKEEDAMPKVGKASEQMRAQCKALKNFFDNCLGEGAGVKLCTEKNHLVVHYQAYEAFLNFVRAQKDEIVGYKNTFSQYSNRQQRRAAQKTQKNSK